MASKEGSWKQGCGIDNSHELLAIIVSNQSVMRSSCVRDRNLHTVPENHVANSYLWLTRISTLLLQMLPNATYTYWYKDCLHHRFIAVKHFDVTHLTRISVLK